MNWKKEIITVLFTWGEVPVDANVFGVWAVHKTVTASGQTKGGWVLTHAPSGKMFTKLKSQKQGIDLVEYITAERPHLAIEQNAENLLRGDNREFLIDILRNGAPKIFKGKMSPAGVVEMLIKNGMRPLRNRGFGNQYHMKAGEAYGIGERSLAIFVADRYVILNRKDPETRSMKMVSMVPYSRVTKELIDDWSEKVRNSKDLRKVLNLQEKSAGYRRASGMPEELQIALNQLTESSNGQRILAMFIGAKKFLYSEKDMFVQFNHMPGGKYAALGKDAARTRLYYNVGSDDYDLEFLTIRGNTIRRFSGLYGDQLMDTFERQTGLYLSMSRR